MSSGGIDASGGSSSGSAPCNVDNTTQSGDDLAYPLWKFMAKGERSAGGEGNYSWKCNFCHVVKNGSYTRVQAHFLRLGGKGVSTCEKVRNEDVTKMKNMEHEAESFRETLQAKKPPFPNQPISSNTSEATSMPPPSNNAKRRKPDNSILNCFNVQARKNLDAIIARMFYTGALPFNFARNPYYVDSYTFSTNNTIPGYKPPDYNKLRTTLLEEEKENISRLLEPITGTWRSKGVNIVTNGWSDPKRRPLINVMIACESGPMFIKIVDCSSEVKDKNFIADILGEVIDEIGDHNVVQIVTDNASNCKAAGELVEGRYPHIYWTPCVVHKLNLGMKSICGARNTLNNEEVYQECHWISEVHGDALFVKNYIMNHQMRLAIFNTFSSLKLLSVVDTRFASIVVMLKRMKFLKTSLQSMVISEAWVTYRDDNRGQASMVRETILDETWWDKVDYILDFTHPIYTMIRECDTDKASLHLVYEKWHSMMLKVKEAIFMYEHKRDGEESTFFNVVQGVINSRWTKGSTPLHSLAHSLTPRFYTDDWLNEVDGRVPPNVDNNISTQRFQCFRRLYQNFEERRRINT